MPRYAESNSIGRWSCGSVSNARTCKGCLVGWLTLGCMRFKAGWLVNTDSGSGPGIGKERIMDRYDLDVNPSDYASVVKMDPDGPFVLYADVKPLIEALRAIRDTCPIDSDTTMDWQAAWDKMLAAIDAAESPS